MDAANHILHLANFVLFWTNCPYILSRGSTHKCYLILSLVLSAYPSFPSWVRLCKYSFIFMPRKEKNNCTILLPQIFLFLFLFPVTFVFASLKFRLYRVTQIMVRSLNNIRMRSQPHFHYFAVMHTQVRDYCQTPCNTCLIFWLRPVLHHLVEFAAGQSCWRIYTHFFVFLYAK